LAAILFEQRGYKVHIFDKRDDSDMFLDSGRSFNITLTERGLIALRSCGLEQEVLESGVKCYGRQVYDATATPFSTPYGTGENAFLLSISRNRLNKVLLRTMMSRKNIFLNLGYKCTKANLDEGQVEFKNRAGEVVTLFSPFIIG
jgi:kynurenine 3-monooxygenase